MRAWPYLALLGLAGLAACARLRPGPAAPPTQEVVMIDSVEIAGLDLDRAFYPPGEPVRLTVRVRSEAPAPTPARLTLAIWHLARQIDEVQQAVTLTGGDQAVTLTYTPPAEAPRGYGAEVQLTSEAGTPLAAAATAFDVLEHWTQTPRYGFLSDFAPGRADAVETMAWLTEYHVNGLQFYDWMYRHEQFLTDEEPYIDLLGRELSRETVDALVAAAHARGIAAMPYTAVYGASVAFYRQHPDWALYTAKGQPAFFGEDFMVIMDPRPESPWTAHLLDQFDQVLAQTEFDGIHLDQYGDPKVGYDAHGQAYDLGQALADFIDLTRERVQAQRPRGAVVFNAVTNWPIELVAPAGQDLVYIEVWPPYLWFNDLHQLIVGAQELGGGKPVVLAAYLDPAHTHNVRLADAVIFASGGSHIELGERGGMLADPYFPKYQPMKPDLALAVQRLYDYAVRYQDVIGPRTQDATRDYLGRIRIAGVSTSPSVMSDKVWPIVREGRGFTAISLINLLGVGRPEWKEPLPAAPTPLGPSTVEISGVATAPARAWLASPDGADLAPRELTFRHAGETLALDVPDLAYWNLIVLEWTE